VTTGFASLQCVDDPVRTTTVSNAPCSNVVLSMLRIRAVLAAGGDVVPPGGEVVEPGVDAVDPGGVVVEPGLVDAVDPGGGVVEPGLVDAVDPGGVVVPGGLAGGALELVAPEDGTSGTVDGGSGLAVPLPSSHAQATVTIDSDSGWSGPTCTRTSCVSDPLIRVLFASAVILGNCHSYRVATSRPGA
jgi:hypothetical protein